MRGHAVNAVLLDQARRDLGYRSITEERQQVQVQLP
jgi:hypothetical protein